MAQTDIYISQGTVLPFAGTVAPIGWLLCDGSAVSRTLYAGLFGICGVIHGSGDGSTTFNLPDYRGRFLRGQDHGQGRDPDAGGRTTMAPGGASGDAIGSIQGQAFQTHSHSDAGHSHSEPTTRGNIAFNPPGSTSCMDPSLGQGAVSSAATPTLSATAASGTWAQATGNETRPHNANVNYIVKV